MKYKYWFLVLPALILMIVVAPWYMRAQSLTEQEKSVNKFQQTPLKVAATTVSTTTSPSLQIDIGTDKQWLPNDLMLINWKINYVPYTASSTIYFELNSLATSTLTSTSSSVLPIGRGTILNTSNPLKWNVPKDLLPGEYKISAYLYSTSTNPTVASNVVTFKVISDSSTKAVSLVEVTKAPETKLVDPMDMSALEKRILELEKMVALMRGELDSLLGKKTQSQTVQPPVSVNLSQTSDHASSNASTTESLAAKEKDSDNDGLPDNVELLMGTKVNNPDTDGDGFIDGLEVRSGFDPLTKGKLDIKSLIKDYMGGKVISTSTAQELQKLMQKQ